MAGPTRYENKLRADEKKRALIERLLAKGRRPEPQVSVGLTEPTLSTKEVTPLKNEPQTTSPFSKARYGQARVALLDRGQPGVKLWPEVWLGNLVNAALEAAAKKELRLALVWPGTIRSVALIHALATLERFAIGDKKGLRALLYPTKRPSFAALNQFLLNRKELFEWTQQYLTVTISGVELPMEGRDDQNKDMLLMAAKSVCNQDPASLPPSIAELFPHFDWELIPGAWVHYGERFLKRSKIALHRAHRKELWKQSDDGRIAQLGHPQTAPDALFGISHIADAKQRKAALASEDLKGETNEPELVLFDLTRDMQQSAMRNLIRLVPEVIEEVTNLWTGPVGFLVVTDDPKTYFTLRKHLPEEINRYRTRLICDTIVSVRDDYGLSEAPFPQEWVPPHTSLKHFYVGVVDHEAAAEAVRLWHISIDLEPDSSAQRACREAAAFLLRLANLPGGYRDYIAWIEASAFADSIRPDMTWIGHTARILELIERGEFSHAAEATRRTIMRATKLVEAYNEETPIAKRIAKEVSICAAKLNAHVTVAFRFNSDVPVVKAFLERYTGFPEGQAFSAFKDLVEFVNHRELSDILNSDEIPTKFIFVGLPDKTLRILLTSERVPADSLVVLDYRRANDVLTGLRSLQTIDAYKPYRGRIADLADEIDLRIQELPKIIDIEKLEAIRVPRLSLSAAASEASQRADSSSDAWRLELEDGQRVVVGSKVYVYDPDEPKPFHQKNTGNVCEDDLVFVMSHELKDLFESCLVQAGHGVPRGSSFIEMLRNYHCDVLANARRIFGELKPRSLARKIRERMVEISPDAEKCSLNRILYWIDVEGLRETPTEYLKPHSTWSKTDFETFARALGIAENLISVYWMMVTGQRKVLQQAGRELAERYAHVLFNEETAEVLYRLKRETILQLQHEAVRNTYRVVKVIAPANESKENADGGK